MLVSEDAVRRSGYALCVLAGAVVSVAAVVFFLVISAGGDAMAATIFQVVSIVVAVIFAGFGVFCIVEREALAINRLAKAAGLDSLDRHRAQFQDFRVIVPEKHRRRNPEVAAATVRVTMQAWSAGDKLFSRIANTLLTPTDVVQLFGPLLDDFVYVFAQSVESLDGQHTAELLDLVRSGSASPQEAIAYLGRLQSVTAAVRMLRERIPLDYAGAVL